MAPKIPDEILSQILAPLFQIPDHLFLSTSLDSPFATSSSTSSILLVSKSWFRVGTLLLYSFVILRSKGQATALQATLRDLPDLGRFVKHLRVENGYGMSMYQILRQTPNVARLVLSLHIRDSSDGLVKGLPLINPKHLAIIDETEMFLKNKS
ncbi:hypothetical protein B0H16DRAFT_1896265 [Mycena metata]|uniref:F-box domain-containing protein n=1 Tax=Mycena metata TaxID=1033252 RepID=A0AAD7MLS3_9AGAR|nr:hypothetical protein B0H16DRAFT_1896265 [Mycena metata]